MGSESRAVLCRAMSPAITYAILGAIFIFAGLSAIISGMEGAFFSLQPHQMRRLREATRGCNDVLDDLIANPRRFLSMILLADALVNLPLCLLCLFGLRELAVEMRLSFWASALVLFGLIVVICDLVPKVIAARNPYHAARLSVGVARVTRSLFEPMAASLERLSEALADLFTPRKMTMRRSLTGDEIEVMVQLGEEEGSLHAIESEMIQEILKLGDKRASDCMTPRVEMFMLSDDVTNAEAIEEFRKTRMRRLPVYGATRDDIVGLLDARRFLTQEDREAHFTNTMDPPSFVPETMPALDLLRSFLKHPQGVAIVLDEFGGVEGVVTFSDIIEEIISDAVPRSDQGLYIEKMPDDRLLVSGSARLDDLSEEMGVELKEEGVDTIQGLLFNRLGHLPKPGTSLDLQGFHITIRRSTRRRIRELLIEPPRESAKAEEEDQETE